MIKRPDQKLCFALKLTKPKCEFLKLGIPCLAVTWEKLEFYLKLNYIKSLHYIGYFTMKSKMM